MIKTKPTVTTSKPKAKPAKKKPAPKGKSGKAKAKPEAAKPAAPPAADPKPKGERPQGGGSQPKLTERDIPRVIAMLRNCGGIKTVTAEKLNVSRTTLYAFLSEHPEIQAADSEIADELLDVAEGQVVIALRSGDMQTVRWYLELKGKERGYVRRVETTGKNGGPVETQERANPKDYTDEELDVLIAAAQRRKAAEAQG